MDAKGKEKGILKLEPRPRAGAETRLELTPQVSYELTPSSPQPSVDRLSVTWAEPDPNSMTSSGVNLFHLPSETNEVKFSPATGEGSEDEDYSASLSAVLRQRRASVRRSRKGRTRRPSSPFLPDEPRPRRRSSVFTTSSGDTAISMEEGQPAVVTQEQIFANIHLHKEVLGSVKQQPLGMRRKLKLVLQAKAYIKRHEGQLQERLAQSKSTRDIYARFNILLATKWQQMKREAANTSNLLIPWELRIKEIESHFGSVVASYFTFLRWLFWVNLVIAFILLMFVIIPEYLTANPQQDGERKIIMEEEKRNASNLLTLWEFEGILKFSPIFYGYYTNVERPEYRMPLAYFLTGLVVYIYSFVAILRKMAENSRMSKLSEKEDECIFSWKLFTGWDFMIGNTETAHNRIASIILGFKEALLEEAEKKKDLRNWRIISLRAFVNMCVAILLVVSAYAVVNVVSRTDDNPKVRSWWRENETTVVVTVISITFPVFFELLGYLEHYHPRKQLRLQLARIMLLNLLNLYSLIFALFSKIQGMSHQLDTLKPTLIMNATTIANTTIHINESLPLKVPITCIEVSISCAPCNMPLTIANIKAENVPPIAITTTTPMSILYNDLNKMHPKILMENVVLTTKGVPNIILPRNLIDKYGGVEMESGYGNLLLYTNGGEEKITSNEYTTIKELGIKSDPGYLPSNIETVTEKMKLQVLKEYIPSFELSSTEYDTSKETDFTKQTFGTDMSSSTEIMEENTSSSLKSTDEQVETTTEDIIKKQLKLLKKYLTNNYDDRSLEEYVEEDTYSFDDFDTTVSPRPSTISTEVVSTPSLKDDSNDTDSTLSTEVTDYETTDTVSHSTMTETDTVSLSEGTFSSKSDYTTNSVMTDTQSTIKNVTVPVSGTEAITTATAVDETETYSASTVPTFTYPSSGSTSSNSTTLIETVTICPNISFNCTVKCGAKNVTHVFFIFNCTLVEKKCYTKQCSIKVHENMTMVDVMYEDEKKRRTYNLTKNTKKQLLKLCWETMFGQELVKLTMMDLVFVLLGTLFMDFFRALFVRYMNRCWCWDLEKKFPEYGDFKIAENILHLINNQGMVWMGMFFSPGLVVLNVSKLMIMMYLRSWAVMTCNVPHEVVFRVSKSNNFYLALLLTMLFLCVLPVGYTVVWVKPSWHCGPFSEYEKIYYILTSNVYKLLPKSLNFALEYIASPAIVIPLLVLLILIIYYLTSLTNSLREANNDLKIQLRRERTEERRKMFQLADTRRRVGSSALDNTPFARWKKALPALPTGKSIDSEDKKTVSGNEADAPPKTTKKRGGIFAKIVGLALDKKTDDPVSGEVPPSPNNVDEETDTDFHETLPKEVLKIKDITIVPSAEKKKSNVEFRTEIAEKFKNSLKVKLKEESEKRPAEVEKRKEHRPPVVEEIDDAEHSSKRPLQRKQTTESTNSKQSDSFVLPVITISTTESDDEALQPKKGKEKIKDERKDKEGSKKKTRGDLKSLRRQSSVDSANEPKAPKEKKGEDAHKYQYSL